MAADDQIITYNTPVTLVNANGASISNNTISGAAGSMATTDIDDYQGCDFALTCAFGGTPTAGTVLSLILRPLNIDGTADAPVPTATYLNVFVGNFNVLNSTSTTYLCRVWELPCREFECYLYNNATGQSVSANWTLKATPWTYRPSAS